MIKNLLDSDEEPETERSTTSSGGFFGTGPEVIDIFSEENGLSPDAGRSRDQPSDPGHQFSRPDYTPPTAGQTVRMTGLAWSAGISLFGSIVFMLILGWFADLLLGTSPWGIVGGIVIGAVIGFIQFFRINSEIFKTAKGGNDGGSGPLLK